MQQRSVPEVMRQLHQILNTERVDIERLVERRIEVDHTSGVDDRGHTPAQVVAQFRRKAAERLFYVAIDRSDLFLQEALEVRPILLTQWHEHLTRGDPFPETLLGALPLFRAHHEVHVTEFGKAREQETPPHLAQKARAANDHQ